MLSAGCKYGLHATLYLVQNGEAGPYIPIRAISSALDIPRHYLAKVLQQLTQSGILKALRGPHGGVALARPADEIALMDIIEVLDERFPFRVCLIGWPGCASPASCLLDEWWACANAHVQDMLRTTTLAEAARRLNQAHEHVNLVERKTVTECLGERV